METICLTSPLPFFFNTHGINIAIRARMCKCKYVEKKWVREFFFFFGNCVRAADKKKTIDTK